jgi:hypothetical protein
VLVLFVHVKGLRSCAEESIFIPVGLVKPKVGLVKPKQKEEQKEEAQAAGA